MSLHSALLARCTFPASGTRVDCAVSGGADSLALLALALEAGCVATAIHVDHGLRPDSAADAEVVRAAAKRLGASFRCEAVAVAPGSNLEARARAARYGVLPAGVLVGHTADDQAETVLLNLLRGSGLHGAAAMRGDRRPMLGLRRSETAAVCKALGLNPIVDPSNFDPQFRRNRVRHELLPLLDEIAQRDVVPLITRFSDLAGESVDHLDAEARLIDPSDAKMLAGAPSVLARLAIRNWLSGLDEQRHPPDAETVERVLAVARQESIATDVGGGRRVARTRGRLRIETPPSPDGAVGH